MSNSSASDSATASGVATAQLSTSTPSKSTATSIQLLERVNEQLTNALLNCRSDAVYDLQKLVDACADSDITVQEHLQKSAVSLHRRLVTVFDITATEVGWMSDSAIDKISSSEDDSAQNLNGTISRTVKETAEDYEHIHALIPSVDEMESLVECLLEERKLRTDVREATRLDTAYGLLDKKMVKESEKLDEAIERLESELKARITDSPVQKAF